MSCHSSSSSFSSSILVLHDHTMTEKSNRNEKNQRPRLFPKLFPKKGLIEQKDSMDEEMMPQSRKRKHHHQQQLQQQQQQSSGADQVSARRLRRSLFVCNFCNSITQTMPVVLIPLIAAEQPEAASFIAAAASISTIGGAVGQFVNGFVCQHMGGRRSSSIYMLGMALCAVLLSTAKSQIGVILCAMEFFATIQWISSSSILFNHFEGHPKAFGAGITAMSLANTIGTLVAKAFGMVLLQYFHWSQVSQLSAAVAVIGAMVMQGFVAECPPHVTPTRPPFSFRRILTSTMAVLGSGLFWMVGLAHATSSLASTSDRVLGSFFQDVSTLPRSVCGGLTVSVTVGFIHGLVTANHYPTMDQEGKKQMLARRYGTASVAALILAASAHHGVVRPHGVAVIVALASGAMASSLSFQFYQIPNMVASVYGEHQAICVAFLDGIGYTLAAPIWALVGRIVVDPSLGWSFAWALLAGLFAVGGAGMLYSLPLVWNHQEASHNL